ncbi:hypothetical protein [Trinickia sp.]|uniref:hypothetical protein n=1 Tax=Trinickia sp. TaxID=2571163 RepID=UPI003F7EFB68
MKTALPLLALVIAASICRAEEPDSVTARKMADCTVPAVVGIKMYEADQRIADLVPTTMPLLTRMQALVAKAHNPKQPVGEQLSGEDNEEFGEIRSRLMTLQWHQLIESRYAKHMQLIEKMDEAVDTAYRWGREPDESSPDFMADATPAVLQQVNPINSFAPPAGDHCTLLWALHLQEQPSLTALNGRELDAAVAQVKQLQLKYNTQHVNRSALSTGDQRVFDDAQATLQRLQREATHAQEIEQIKMMAEAAETIYTASMKELEQSAGDPNSSINTLQKMQHEGRISAQMATRIGVWSKLDEKYPSDQAIEMQQMQKAMAATPGK